MPLVEKLYIGNSSAGCVNHSLLAHYLTTRMHTEVRNKNQRAQRSKEAARAAQTDGIVLLDCLADILDGKQTQEPVRRPE